METWANRVFDSSQAVCGGAIRSLSIEKLRFTQRGLDVVCKHLRRFGFPSETPREALMVERLEALVIRPERIASSWERQFYAHELREFVRYRRLGIHGEGTWEEWNNAHTAALKDYGVVDAESMLYDPEVGPPR